MATRLGERDALKLRYRVNVRSVCRDKRNSIIALMREVETAANLNNFATIFLTTKEVAGSHRPFDNPVRDVNSPILIHDDKQLRRWKEHFERFV